MIFQFYRIFRLSEFSAFLDESMECSTWILTIYGMQLPPPHCMVVFGVLWCYINLICDTWNEWGVATPTIWWQYRHVQWFAWIKTRRCVCYPIYHHQWWNIFGNMWTGNAIICECSRQKKNGRLLELNEINIVWCTESISQLRTSKLFSVILSEHGDRWKR